MPASSATYWISDRRQLKALASPARQEIVDAVTAAGPSTIAGIADALGTRPDRLYFHIRQLVKVGLLVSAGINGSGREEAKVYDVPGRPLRLRSDPTKRAAQRTVGEIHDGVLRLARRDLKRAMSQPGVITHGPARDVWAGRARGWMTDSEIRELDQLVEKMLTLVRDGRPRKGARPVAFTFVVAPPKRPGGAGDEKGTKS
mgnify:CR=1 FL=1